MTKLKFIKGKLKNWNVEVFGDTRLKKQSLLRRIKELDILESSGMWNVEQPIEGGKIRGKDQFGKDYS